MEDLATTTDAWLFAEATARCPSPRCGMLGTDTFAGVRIVDLTRLLPGPFATMLFTDLGAEVLKVEEPGTGDYARWYPPRLVEGDRGYGAFFDSLNRGKKGLTADLRSDAGRSRVLRLIEQSDILVEGFRPGVLERLGLDPDALLTIKPSLIVCRISGWGQTGPLASKAGHDLGFLARSGILARTGPANAPPQLSPVQIADLAGGALQAAFAIAAALYQRTRTGRGGVLDVAMAEGAMSLLRPHFAMWAHRTSDPPRGGEMLSGGLPCYRCYETSDGRHLAVSALEPIFWQRFCSVLHAGHLQGDGWTDGAAGEAIAAEVARLIRAESLDEWVARFAGVDACVEPILSLDEVVRDAHWIARGALEGGLPRPPTSPPGLDAVTPTLGQHDAMYP